MDDSEKTTDSMLLEEAMAETEKSTQEVPEIVGDLSEEEHQDLVDNLGMVQDGSLVEGVMESDDVEMPDGVAEDSENNNLAPEDSMDAPAALLEGEDGSEEVSQGTISNSDEAFLGDQFISQTDSMIVQSEPPQQLMEEADVPGDGETGEGMIAESSISEGSIVEPAVGEGATVKSTSCEGLIGEGVVDESSAVVTEPIATDESCGALATDQTGEELTGEEEALLLHQDDDNETSEQHDESVRDGVAHGAQLHGDEEDRADNSEEGIVLHLEEDDEDGAGDGTGGLALLAEGDQLEGALSELEGKIAAAADAQLTGQENLQGIQLMEGDDDKPDEEVAALGGDVVQQNIQAALNAALLKQEEMKTEADDQPEGDAFPGEEPSAEADALATLASAALDHQAPSNGVKHEIDESQIKSESDAQEPEWMDVGICKGTHCQVRSYYIPRSGLNWDQNWEGITTSTLPDHRSLAKLELESGKAYKFRVAAINSCGRGPWSEVAAFKTSLPGFPGAPSAIKIAKTTDGAHLSWEPPPIASGVIEDYHVYLAVRTATTDSSRVVSSGANQLAFVRIYQGAANQCTVGNETLSKAHIDMTTKPAILFRISARNEKGIGPATQVRWLQEIGAPNTATRPTYAPRRPAAEGKVHGNYKRKKSE